MSEPARPDPFGEPDPASTPAPESTPPPASTPTDAIPPGPETLVTPAVPTTPTPGAAPAPAAAPAPGRGIRMRTIVLGLVLLVISASVLLAMLSSVRIDVTAVVLAVLLGAGAALVAGGLAAAMREARGGPGA